VNTKEDILFIYFLYIVILLYLTWGKTLCCNSLRGPYDCGVGAEKTSMCNIF